MKILIIRFSSIGDIVLTTPVVRCLKKQLPQAEVHYLTKPQFKSLLAPNPYIHTIHVLQDSLQQTARSLKAFRFDYVIDLHNNQRTFAIKTLLGRPSKSFNKLNLEKWLMVQLKVDRLPSVHIVDRYLQTVAPLGIVNDGAGLDHFLPDDLKPIDSALGIPESYVAMAIGAQHATKRLTQQQLIELCSLIQKPVVLLGGPDDEPTGQHIAQQAGNHVINACGKLSLHQSAKMVRDALVVVTHDTGLMHIAAAYQKPTLSIWGNTIPKFGMYPYYGKVGAPVESKMYQVEGLSCRPCSKIGYNTCPKGHFKCMKMQNIPAIAASVMALPG